MCSQRLFASNNCLFFQDKVVRVWNVRTGDLVHALDGRGMDGLAPLLAALSRASGTSVYIYKNIDFCIYVCIYEYMRAYACIYLTCVYIYVYIHI